MGRWLQLLTRWVLFSRRLYTFAAAGIIVLAVVSLRAGLITIVFHHEDYV